ncbi:hypothetical protein AWENTII_010184 [Aspergillus wentii]|nr:hypothetical protein MW887_008332 [Aspergillus wentii]
MDTVHLHPSYTEFYGQPVKRHRLDANHLPNRAQNHLWTQHVHRVAYGYPSSQPRPSPGIRSPKPKRSTFPLHLVQEIFLTWEKVDLEDPEEMPEELEIILPVQMSDPESPARESVFTEVMDVSWCPPEEVEAGGMEKEPVAKVVGDLGVSGRLSSRIQDAADRLVSIRKTLKRKFET